MLKKIFNFYLDGFREMSWHSRKLWVIIIVKLLIIFFVLKVFFFPDFLDSRYKTENEKSNHVIEQLINN
jgi:hypothetical protein